MATASPTVKTRTAGSTPTARTPAAMTMTPPAARRQVTMTPLLQGKPMMNRFGQLGLTTVSNGLNFVAQTIGILSQTHGQMYAYVMATVRIPISSCK